MKGDFHLGEWLVQPQLNKVRCATKEVGLEPKAMEVLAYLAHHGGEVVNKNRIIQAVWPDAFVTDNVLSHSISQLRKAFQDDARSPRFIETIPGRGYRLMPAPAWIDDASSTPASKAASHARNRLRSLAVLIGACCFAVALLLLWRFSVTLPAPTTSLAVLPFVGTGNGPESDYLRTGIPQSISASLSEVSGLTVVPADSLAHVKGDKLDLDLLSEQLGVGTVLTGNLFCQADTISLKVQLIDVRTKQLLWGGQYRENFDAIFDLEEKIARQIVSALRVRLTTEGERSIKRRVTQDPNAYRAYLEGAYFFDHFLYRGGPTAESGLRKAIAHLERAVAIDRNYSDAYLMLSRVYYHLAWEKTSSPEEFAEARSAAERALETSNLAKDESHLIQAQLLAYWDRDWKGAERHFQEVAKLNPDFRPPVGYLLWIGKREQAVAQLDRGGPMSEVLGHAESLRNLRQSERGVELLPAAAVARGWFYYSAGEVDKAIAQGEKGLEREPGLPGAYQLLGLCYIEKGQQDRGVELLIQGIAGHNPEELRRYREAYKVGGARSFWQDCLLKNAMEQKKPYGIAAAYARLGDKQAALTWLEKTYELPVHQPFRFDPSFKGLHDEPGYLALMRTLNLEP
jgi:DNA-binding winged helix-turn-helix (wHTH) protein/TolB-like protein